MNIEPKEEKTDSPERITIKTGSSKYTFSPSWLENEGLRGILTGLVADDLNKTRDAMQ